MHAPLRQLQKHFSKTLHPSQFLSRINYSCVSRFVGRIDHCFLPMALLAVVLLLWLGSARGQIEFPSPQLKATFANVSSSDGRSNPLQRNDSFNHPSGDSLPYDQISPPSANSSELNDTQQDDDEEWIVEAAGTEDSVNRYLMCFGLRVERKFRLFNHTYIVKRLTPSTPPVGNHTVDNGNLCQVSDNNPNDGTLRSRRTALALEERVLRGITAKLVPSPVWSIEWQYAKVRSQRDFQPITAGADTGTPLPNVAGGQSLLQQLLSSALPAATAQDLFKPSPLSVTGILNQDTFATSQPSEVSVSAVLNSPATVSSSNSVVNSGSDVSTTTDSSFLRLGDVGNQIPTNTANETIRTEEVRNVRDQQVRMLLPDLQQQQSNSDRQAQHQQLVSSILQTIQQLQQQKQEKQAAAQTEISAAKTPGVPIKVQNADNSYFVSALDETATPTSAYMNAVRFNQQQQLEQLKSRISTDLRSAFSDPLWHEQWYMVNGHASAELRAMLDLSYHPSIVRLKEALGETLHLNIPGAWGQGYTGRGVVVSVVDDGLDHRHPDLAANYDARASIDLNDNDDDPTPRNVPGTDIRHVHGTRCGGEIAMVANNNKCGVGVAFNARLGGIRMLDGKVSDRVESEALGHALDYIDIFSSSWGPDDDGKTLEAPGKYVRKVLEMGTKVGRNGLGAIYVWATGNGGQNGDSCAGDGYASNVYTLGVGAVTEMGRFPKYGEACSATMAVTYSSGEKNEGKIVSVDIGDKCTTLHTGTSAAAPLAAGIIALALEANPRLTWRDVQHLVVWTSDPRPITQFSPNTWGRNGVGLYVSNFYGFGLLNADNMVRAASRWTRVPEYHTCLQRVLLKKPLMLFNVRPLVVKIAVDACKSTPSKQVNYVEHVQVRFSLEVKRRGSVSVEITSPSGTHTVLMPERRNDLSEKGFDKWALLSVHQWGENPVGTWVIKFSSSAHIQRESLARLSLLELSIMGTADMPQHMRMLNKNVTQDAVVTNVSSAAVPDVTLADAVMLNTSLPLKLISRMSDAAPGEPMVAALNLPANGSAVPPVSLLAPPTTSGAELTPEQVDALADASDWSRV